MDVRKFYDNYAATYDRAPNKTPYVAPHNVAKAVARYAKSRKLHAPTIIDLGCGTGMTGVELKRAIPTSIIDGIDISVKSLDVAASKQVYRKLNDEDIFNVKTLQKMKKYNVACAVGVLEFLPPSLLVDWLKEVPAEHVVVTLPVTPGIPDTPCYMDTLKTLSGYWRFMELEMYPGWHYAEMDVVVDYAQVSMNGTDD